MNIKGINTIQGLTNFLKEDSNITDDFYIVKYIDRSELKVRTSDRKNHDFMTFYGNGNFELSNDLTEESGYYIGNVMKFIKYSDNSKWFAEPRYNVILIQDDNGTYSFLKKGKGYSDNLLFFVVTGSEHPCDDTEHSLDDEDSKFDINEISDLKCKRYGRLRNLIDMSLKEVIE